MPSPDSILSDLTLSANQYSLYAVIWHVLFLAFIIALLLKWRPTNRIAGILLTIPILSVAVFSALIKNYFNGIAFFIGFILLLIFAIKLPKEKVLIKINFGFIVGVLMILFGFVYPHFLENPSFLKYIYSAPVGIVPCPTLIVVIGFTLLFNQFKSRAWPMALSAIGIIYGAMGIIMLGVYLDIALIAGSIILLVLTLVSKSTDVKNGN